MYILSLLLLAGCSLLKPVVKPSPPPTSATVQPEAKPHTLGYEERLRFNELYHAGLVARVGQRFDEAFELFQEATRINPLSAEAAYELALLYQDVAGQDTSRLFPLADSLLQASVKLAPSNKFYKIALIENYVKQERYAETTTLAREVADEYPTAENYLRLENLCEFAEDYEGALYALEHLERIEGPSLENSLYKFTAYQHLGREADGYRAMEELCRAFPSELRYRVRMGDLYFSGGHEEMALATYRDVLTLDPDNDAAQYAMLEYYLQHSDTAHFNALVPVYLLNPRADNYEKEILLSGYFLDNGVESPEVARLLNTILFVAEPQPMLVNICAEYLSFGAEAYAHLEHQYSKILELSPQQDRIRMKILQIYNERGDSEAIIQCCQEGRLYSPGNAIYYFLEGITLAHQGAYNEALDVLDDGTEYASAGTTPSVIAMLYSSRAEILLEMGDVEDACAAYDSALVYDPANPDYLANYAVVLNENGLQAEKALTLSRQALDAAGTDPFYLATYAYALACVERYEEAREMSDTAITYAAQTPDWETNPDYGRLLDHTGDIYYHLGHTGDAVNFWQQAIRRITDSDIKSMIQQKIRRRRL